jgi:hypothetical protein
MMVLALVFLALSMTGCKKEEPATPGDGGVRETYEVERRTTDMAETAEDTMAEQKDQYVNQVSQQIEQMKERFGLLKERADAMGDQGKQQYEQMKTDFDNKAENASEQLNLAKDASGSAWMDAKGNVEKAINELRDAYNKAAQQFGQQPQPQQQQ